MKKICLWTLILLMFSINAFAHNHVWYDKSAGIGKLRKVVVFPINGHKNVKDIEDLWKDYLTKRNKNVYFALLTPDNAQESMIIVQNEDYLTLLNDYATEADRAKAVKEKTGADAYLICNIRTNKIQTDWSPEKVCYVNMTSYTRITDAPDGDRTINRQTWSVRHVVPGQYVYLNILNLEYCLYDTNGNKIMLLQHRIQGYNTNEEEQFKNLLTEFSKEFKEAKKNKGK